MNTIIYNQTKEKKGLNIKKIKNENFIILSYPKIEILKYFKKLFSFTDLNINSQIDLKDYYINKTIIINRFKFYNNIDYVKILKGNFIFKNKINNEKLFNFLIVWCVFLFQNHTKKQINNESDDNYFIRKKLGYKANFKNLEFTTKLLTKFYKQKIFNLNQIEIFLRLLIVLSINEKEISKILEDNNEKKKNIKNFTFLKSSLNLLKEIFLYKKDYLNKEEEIVLNNYLKFFNKYIFQNNIPNQYLFFEIISKNIINLNDLIIIQKNFHEKNFEYEKNLFNLFFNIFKLKLTYSNLMHFFINNIKNNFIYLERIFNNNKTNFEKKIESLLNHTNFSLNYFEQSIAEENLNNSNDILNGFYFKKQNSCLYVDCTIHSKKNFLLFSFNFMGDDIKKTYTIIEFYNVILEKDKIKKIYFSFVLKYLLKDGMFKLFIEKSDNKNNIETNIEIKQNINYFFKVCIENKNNKIHYLEDKSKEIKIIDIENFYNYDTYNYNIIVGAKFNKKIEASAEKENYLNNLNNTFDTFEGKIGTIILSGKNSIFKDKFNQKYENILLEHFQEEIYKNLYLLISSRSFIKSISNEKFDNIFLKIDYDKKIEKNHYYCYENMEYSIKPNYYKYSNYLSIEIKDCQGIKDKIIKISDFTNFDENFFPFQNNFTFEQFFSCDGMNYLILLLEFYYQLICKLVKCEIKENNKINKKISLILNNIFSFLFAIFNSNNLNSINEFDEKNLKKIIFIISFLLNKFSEISNVIFILKNNFFLLLQNFYERIELKLKEIKKNNENKKEINEIIFFSDLYYSLLILFFENKFYSDKNDIEHLISIINKLIQEFENIPINKNNLKKLLKNVLKLGIFLKYNIKAFNEIYKEYLFKLLNYESKDDNLISILKYDKLNSKKNYFISQIIEIYYDNDNETLDILLEIIYNETNFYEEFEEIIPKINKKLDDLITKEKNKIIFEILLRYLITYYILEKSIDNIKKEIIDIYFKSINNEWKFNYNFSIINSLSYIYKKNLFKKNEENIKDNMKYLYGYIFELNKVYIDNFNDSTKKEINKFYNYVMSFLKNILESKHVEIIDLFFNSYDKKNNCNYLLEFFSTLIINNFKDEFLEDIKTIYEKLILYNKNGDFIFKLISKFINIDFNNDLKSENNIENNNFWFNLLIKIIDKFIQSEQQIIKELNEKNENEYDNSLLNNLIYALIFYYQISLNKLNFYENKIFKNSFFSLIDLIFRLKLMTLRNLICVDKEKKLICEMVFNILLNCIRNFKNENILKEYENMFIKIFFLKENQPNNKILSDKIINNENFEIKYEDKAQNTIENINYKINFDNLECYTLFFYIERNFKNKTKNQAKLYMNNNKIILKSILLEKIEGKIDKIPNNKYIKYTCKEKKLNEISYSVYFLIIILFNIIKDINFHFKTQLINLSIYLYENIYNLKKKFDLNLNSNVTDSDIYNKIINSFEYYMAQLQFNSCFKIFMKCPPVFLKQYDSNNFNILNIININDVSMNNKIDIYKKSKKNLKIENFDDENESFEINKNNIIVNFKKEIIMVYFINEFRNVYFKDKNFINLKKYYSYEYKIQNCYDKQINYPSKIKNYSDGLHPALFLKINKKFFEEENKVFFNITHNYFLNKIKDELKNNINFQKKLFEFPCFTSFDVELLTIEDSIFGNLKIYKNFFIFQNCEIKNGIDYIFSTDDILNKEKKIIIFFEDIKEIFQRRFLLMKQAIEIFLKNGKSYFFNLFKTSNYIKFKEIIQQKELSKKLIEISYEFKNKEYYKEFMKKNLTTYEYLLYLNKYSSRTYNDTNQYYILPWILKDYKLMNIITDNLRNFDYPISLQSDMKRENAMSKFEEEENLQDFKSHLGTHYSTSSYVFYYLMRNSPFTENLIKLQGYQQENTNRMFSSLYETQNILSNSIDNRELIPEFFEKIEQFINLNCVNFGKKQNAKQVDNLLLFDSYENNEKYLTNIVDFIIVHRALINNKEIKNEILNWVNIIFGSRQYPTKEIKECCNIYSIYCYENYFNLEKKLEECKKELNNNEEKIISIIKSQKNCIINFGQCPVQIFKDEHQDFKKEEIQTENIIKNKKIINEEKIDFNVLHFEVFNKSTIIFISSSEKKNETNNREKELIIYNNFLLENKKKKDNFIGLENNQEININEEADNNINNGNTIYLDSFKYSLIHLKEEIFLIGKNSNNFLLLYNSGKIKKDFKKFQRIYLEDYVNSLCKITEETILIGLNSGKILYSKIYLNNNSYCLETINSFYAHLKPINIIELHLDLIITSGLDNYVYIRKKYDFEVLSCIKIDINNYIKLIKISNLNFIYMLCFDKDIKKFKMLGYTLNGIKFIESYLVGMVTSNFEINEKGNIIVCYFDYNNKVYEFAILKGSDLSKKNTIKINDLIVNYKNEDIINFKILKEINRIIILTKQKIYYVNMELLKKDIKNILLE